jgi:hypothetical protein
MYSFGDPMQGVAFLLSSPAMAGQVALEWQAMNDGPATLDRKKLKRWIMGRRPGTNIN